MVPKFRAYDTKNKVMVTNFHRSHMKIETGKVLYQLTTTNENEIKAIASYNTFDDYIYRYSHDLELMQSTGLKDKNGVEIFEGDLVEHDDNINGDWETFEACEVEYDEDYAQFCFKWDASNFLSNYRNLNIIGNIYENSEQLEQANEN